MTRDEAFYAFGAAIGDQKCGLHFPELLRFGLLPKATAPLPEQMEFVGRVAVACGWSAPYVGWYLSGPWVRFLSGHEGTAPDLCHAALLAALAALETR